MDPIIFIPLALVAAITLWVASRLREFGARRKGPDLYRYADSPHFRDGRFRNLHPYTRKPPQSPGSRRARGKKLQDLLFTGGTRRPPVPLPVRRDGLSTEASGVETDPTALVWLGHSTVLIRIDGLTVITDPVFSRAIFPLRPLAPKAFDYAAPITVGDLPDIDVVLLSHDHYDHLDYPSIRKLAAKADRFVVTLGVGEHLKKWGVSRDRIDERDWWQSIAVGPLTFTATPAQHFSGRGLRDAGQTLWASWVIEGTKDKLFFSGDTGYFEGFKEIGERLGPFDITLLECGAYNVQWPNVHMMPEETVQAHLDLGGRALQPIHWGKFDLSVHAWDEPVERLIRAAAENGVTVATPMVGQTYRLSEPLPHEPWWRRVGTPESAIDDDPAPAYAEARTQRP